MNVSPLVSIILPVYNAEKYLNATIESILKQKYKNIEIIIIDDGSNDNSLQIINSYIDVRIKVISRENRGLIETLNQCISLSNGKYIARIDADDICHEDRIHKQVLFLEKNGDVALVGSSFKTIDKNGDFISNVNLYTECSDLKKWFFIGNPICHPSVMINYNLLGDKVYYDKNWDTVEDFELWLRVSKDYKIANINEYLINYRIHENSISSKKIRKQLLKTNELKRLYFKNDKFKLSLLEKEYDLMSKGFFLNKSCKFYFAIKYFIGDFIRGKKINKISFRIAAKFFLKNDHENFKRV